MLLPTGSATLFRTDGASLNIPLTLPIPLDLLSEDMGALARLELHQGGFLAFTPEPSTALLLGLGLVGLAVARRHASG